RRPMPFPRAETRNSRGSVAAERNGKMDAAPITWKTACTSMARPTRPSRSRPYGRTSEYVFQSTFPSQMPDVRVDESQLGRSSSAVSVSDMIGQFKDCWDDAEQPFSDSYTITGASLETTVLQSAWAMRP